MTEIEAERERLAKMVEEYIWTRDKAGERVVLAIAAKAIRRGRMLTACEQLENLAKAMAEADDEPQPK